MQMSYSRLLSVFGCTSKRAIAIGLSELTSVEQKSKKITSVGSLFLGIVFNFGFNVFANLL